MSKNKSPTNNSSVTLRVLVAFSTLMAVGCPTKKDDNSSQVTTVEGDCYTRLDCEGGGGTKLEGSFTRKACKQKLAEMKESAGSWRPTSGNNKDCQEINADAVP